MSPSEVSLFPSIAIPVLSSNPGHSEPLPPISPAAILAPWLGVDLASGEDLEDALRDLAPSQRKGLQDRLGGEALAEILSLRKERDPKCFFAALLHLGQSLEREQRFDAAASIYRLIHEAAENSECDPFAQRARECLDTLQGRGNLLPVAEHFARGFAEQNLDPALIAGIGAAGTAFRATRLALFSRIAVIPAGALTSRALPNLLAFGVESLAFTSTVRGVNAALDRENRGTFLGDLASGSLFLGSLKMGQALSGSILRGVHRMDASTGRAERWTSLAPVSVALVSQAMNFGSIMAADWTAERLGLRESRSGAQRWVEGLGSLLNLQVGGRISREFLGADFDALERRLDVQSARLSLVSARWRRITREALMTPGLLMMGMTAGPLPRIGGRVADMRNPWERQISQALSGLFPAGRYKTDIATANVVNVPVTDKNIIYNRTLRTVQDRSKPLMPTIISLDVLTMRDRDSAVKVLEGGLERALKERGESSPNLVLGMMFPKLPRPEVVFFNSTGRVESILPLNAEILKVALGAQPTVSNPATAPIPPVSPPAPARIDPRTLETAASSNPTQPVRVAPQPAQPAFVSHLESVFEITRHPRIEGIQVEHFPPNARMTRISGFFGDQIATVRRILQEDLSNDRSPMALVIGNSGTELDSDRVFSQILQEIHQRAAFSSQFRMAVVLTNRQKAWIFSRTKVGFDASISYVNRRGGDPTLPAPEARSQPTSVPRPPQASDSLPCSNIRAVLSAFESGTHQVTYSGLWSEAREQSVVAWVQHKILRRQLPSDFLFQVDLPEAPGVPRQVAVFRMFDGTCVCTRQNVSE